MPLFRHVLNIVCMRVFKFLLDVTCDSETKLCHASVSMNWDLRLEMWPPVPPCSSSPGPYDISILDTAGLYSHCGHGVFRCVASSSADVLCHASVLVARSVPTEGAASPGSEAGCRRRSYWLTPGQVRCDWSAVAAPSHGDR